MTVRLGWVWFALSRFGPDDVFALDGGIRWVGLATKKGQVVFRQMRPGVKSRTPDDDDRMFLELRAQFIAEGCDHWSPSTGPTEYIALSHQKFTELIVILREKYLVMTLEKSVPAEKFQTIAKKAQELWFNA